ncbi:MAG: hypothetical protein IJA81_01650 [Akkermansia sp.]|nr:hypothetical protein [Akkermansia sp.]
MPKIPVKTHTKMPPKRHRYFYGAFPVVARGSRFRGKKVQNLHFTPTTGAGFVSMQYCGNVNKAASSSLSVF